MPKTSYQKKRILFLRNMFLERTDENHPISMNEILALLSANDLSADKRTIYDDIELLNEMGLDIISQKMPSTKYYVGSRDFELFELRLLLDSVQIAKFLSESKTELLIKKLNGLCSKHEAQQLKGHIYRNHIKSKNEKVHYSLSAIHQAISEEKRITFQYCEYLPTKEKQYRRNGELYEVHPYMLIYAEENYYLLGYKMRSSNRRNLKHYRVDKMENIALSYPRYSSLNELFEKININDYISQNFSMYGGRMERVTIQFPNRLAGVVIDRFGIDVDIRITDDEHFQITESIAISPQFFGWVFGLGKEVKIIAPKEVSQEMKDLLQDTYKVYTVPRKRRKAADSSSGDA